MRKCSYCGKENDVASRSCAGCGSPLITESTDPVLPPTPEELHRSDGEKSMTQGVLWLIGGVAVTGLTYIVAAGRPTGGHYIIAYGAIIFGIVQFWRGRAAARGTDGEIRAQELLDAAAQFEGVDRAKAVTLYEEVTRTFPGTRASNEARRNIQTLTSCKE